MRYLSLHSGDEHRTFSNDGWFESALLKGTDIVLFSRECPFNLDTVLKLKQKYGYKIVVDVDDYWHLYPNHYLYEFWIKYRITDRILESIKIADMVFTTNQQLKARISNYNKNVHVVMNSLPYGLEQFTYDPNPYDEKVSIGYIGGVSHYYDLKTIERALDMCKSDPKVAANSRLVLAGYNRKTPIQWNKMLSIVERFGNYKVLESLPLNRYMEHYDYVQLAIAPLADNSFNNCKSTLKIVEAGSKKIPIVCSMFYPYLEDKDAPGVFFCRSARDWYSTIKKLVADPDKLRQHGEALYEYVREKYDIDKENEKRYNLFKTLL